MILLYLMVIFVLKVIYVSSIVLWKYCAYFFMFSDIPFVAKVRKCHKLGLDLLQESADRLPSLLPIFAHCLHNVSDCFDAAVAELNSFDRAHGAHKT